LGDSAAARAEREELVEVVVSDGVEMAEQEAATARGFIGEEGGSLLGRPVAVFWVL
jgi:hypothetical protein